jgi:hypothetical protein
MWWTRGERLARGGAGVGKGRAGRARRHCRQHTRGTPGGRGDEHAPGSVAVGAPGSISAPTRRADSAGASSMTESDSISVSDVARAV